MQTAVYDKSLRLASYTLSSGSLTVGQITNHMSVDAINVLEAFQIIFYLFSVPYLVGNSSVLPHSAKNVSVALPLGGT